MRFVVLLSGLVVIACSGSAPPSVAASRALAPRQPGACTQLAHARFGAAVGAAVAVRSATVVEVSAGLPAYCRVVATIAPKNTVEIRLPVSGWEGRLLMAGCGGLCGAVQMARTDDALARGYAVAHTDMGHAEADLAFADDPQALEDFAHRSTHVATRLLKGVAKAYYGRAHQYAYFRGCSTGGRQGLTAALRYPGDYDGIVAGAPASGAAVPNIAWALQSNTRRDGSSILDVPAIRVLHDAVLRACDLDDSVRDGIVGDPSSCRFDPVDLTCGNAATDACLSGEQVEAARRIYAGVPHPDGTPYASLGYARGGEQGWLRTLVRTDRPPGMQGVAANFLRRYVDLPDAPKSLAAFDFTRLPVRLTAVDELPSFGPDGRRLAAFEKSGGKLLLYHGWSDDSLTPATSIDVYTAHARAFGGRERLDPFFRLFMIPGMYHCRGGPGADAVDFLDAIARWVEQREPPAQLVVYKPAQIVPLPAEYRLPLPARERLNSRPVYPWPATAIYSGKGEVRDASSWRAR